MNKIKDLHHLAKARYDELEKLTTTQRKYIQHYFTIHWLDVLDDKDFEMYKQKLLNGTMVRWNPNLVKNK